MLPEPFTLSDHAGKYSRHVWFFPAPGTKTHPLCVFLDGEHYLRDMDCLPSLAQLLRDGSLPPLSLLFVSHVSSDSAQADYNKNRLADYACNERYARFIAEDVVRWAQERNAAIRPDGNVICGLSLSGLASAYTALRHPRVFSGALCQSGSFWWLAQNDISLPPTQVRFWLSVGDTETATHVTHSPELHQEMSQIAGVENAVKQFKRLGGTVHYNLFNGGHAIAPWKKELPEALNWFTR